MLVGPEPTRGQFHQHFRQKANGKKCIVASKFQKKQNSVSRKSLKVFWGAYGNQRKAANLSLRKKRKYIDKIDARMEHFVVPLPMGD